MRTSVKERQKEEIAANFHGDSLLQRVIYLWKKITNQSMLDKNFIVRGLRDDKAYSLRVKAFSSLLFHKKEMIRIREQKKRYRFFKMNRVYRAWNKFVIRTQEHEIKVNYFRKRWDLIQKNRVVQGWQNITYTWRMLYAKFDRQFHASEELRAKRHMLAWRECFKQQDGVKKARKFKAFKALQKLAAKGRSKRLKIERQLEMFATARRSIL